MKPKIWKLNYYEIENKITESLAIKAEKPICYFLLKV